MKKKIKKILFLTGTRADFGKIKPLILKLQKDKEFNVNIFVTGMESWNKLIISQLKIIKLIKIIKILIIFKTIFLCQKKINE